MNIEELPLSYPQQRLWFLAQFQSDSALYNIPLGLRLVGNLDKTALEQSLQSIIDRHEALRTNFITREGQPTQIIHPESNWTLSLVDLQHLSTTEQEITAQQIMQQQGMQPFDLVNDLLIRGTLIVLSDTEYILMVCLHHIVSDGWSMGVFVQELAAIYKAYIQGQPSPLEPLPVQYGDFALWQRDWLQEGGQEKQLAYWKKQLADATTFLPLPTDRPRPAIQTFTGTYQEFTLSDKLTTKLTELSQQKGVTLFMTLLTAFDVLLYRYTGQEDILVGTPIANRNYSEIEGLIGFFVNTLVLRTDLSNNPSFEELLIQVREVALNAYTHQDLPFEMLVEVLQPERDISHTPLFQVMFSLQNTPLSTLELSGLSINHLQIETGTAKFDLTLAMENTDTGLVGVWEYNTDLFNHDTIERMKGHFVTLLEGIVANPQAKISQIPILTKFEEKQLLIDWNNTKVDYPQDKCIHQLFEEQVKRTPDAVAVVFENDSLTYQELNNRANQLANYLLKLGVKPDSLVGICVERSLEMIVGILGILKAGGAYVPFDPEYPQERLNFMLEDAAVKVLLTQDKLVESIPKIQAHFVCLDREWQVIGKESQNNPIIEIQVTNLVYVIYTSGSTGQPKGVMLSHSNLCNHMFWMQETFPLTEKDKVLQKTPFGFDASVWEFYAPLLVGGQLLMAKPGGHQEPAYLLNLIAQKQVNTVQFVPSLLQMLLEQGEIETCHSLKRVFCGGEVLSVTLQESLLSQLEVNLCNLYGPTETCIDATFWNCNREMSPQVIPIGRPISNNQIYILDAYLQPVPIGVPGELHLGGAGLARGYLNRPQLNAEKFISNPFNNDKNSRLYRTGDLARYLPDGNIEYLGRIDNQVKIRGFRIELGEIEALLSQNKGLKSSCVILREDSSGDKRLAAYLVPHAQVTITSSEIRQFLKAKLPEYMIPSAFVILQALPLTPNGKVDRRILPAPEYSSEQRDKYVAPRTPIEEILATIWAQILKVETVGIYDNFFELGGHSLLATQLVSRIRNLFKVQLPLRKLFAAPTVVELAQVIKELKQQGQEWQDKPILVRDKAVELPLSFAQTRIWFLDQFESNSSFYNIPLALRLTGTLNAEVLIQSLTGICDRHEALRTNFITVDGLAIQVIQTGTPWTVSIVDLQNLSSSEQEIASQELAQNHAIKPFDLANEPLIRATLVLLSETEHLLLVCMHHIISDGWSMGIFIQELTALYNAYIQNQSSSLNPLPIQYGDYTLWQRQWLEGDILQRQLDYWQKQLADAPALLSLPTDRPRPAVQTFAGAHQNFTLSLELTKNLIKLSQEQGTTLFMTLLAAFDILLYRYTEQEDILIGTPIANRNRSELESLIGFFVNTLVLRTDLSGNPSFSELLIRVREMAMDAYDHQDLPFEMLVEALQPERDLSHSPLFQVDFLLQNEPLSQLELIGLTATPLLTENATAKFDLTLGMENTATGLQGVWEYNTNLFNSSTIEQLTGHFITLLEGLVANPQQQISQLPLLPEIEAQRLLIEWNDTQVDYPFHQCIHHLFEEQAERTPDAVAVVFEGQELTYQQLNIQANQLAHYLQSLGVGSEIFVGIYLERSLLVIVGLLAVLKAGGAYVPLDPDYPQQRLTYMAEDAKISLLLTQQSLLNSLPVENGQVIVLNNSSEILTVQSQENTITEDIEIVDLDNSSEILTVQSQENTITEDIGIVDPDNSSEILTVQSQKNTITENIEIVDLDNSSEILTVQSQENTLTEDVGISVLDNSSEILIVQNQENTINEDVGVIVLDNLSDLLTVQSQENPISDVTPEKLLCLLYTSGSTGKPKGVMLAHEALVNHSWGISEVFGLTERDRVLQFASFGFDVAAEEIFPTWLKGGTVVLRPGQMFPTLADFANFIQEESLTLLNITPAYWHEWAIAVSQSSATVPSSLRVVAVGGDAVLPETVNIWRQWVGDRVQCINVYGPTEASVTAIVHDLLHPEGEKDNSVLIGRPIANTKAYVLDRHLQPVPIGVKGELHLCGVRLARGYLNRPELTAEKFIDNPFEPPLIKGGTQRGSKLYKTGDLARYLPDGRIECFGRIDNQVKIRGFRIELGEIEAILNQYIDVQTSCVIIREDIPGQKYLVAYVVSHYERIPMISELRQFLSSNLPLYMVPQAFVFLESLPLTTNRKVDRRALPAPDLYSDRRDQYVAPRNAIEEMLAQIWTEILKIETPNAVNKIETSNAVNKIETSNAVNKIETSNAVNKIETSNAVNKIETSNAVNKIETSNAINNIETSNAINNIETSNAVNGSSKTVSPGLVGIYDNFFEIGGHSLLATQLVSRIRSLFKVELPLRSLFAASTIAELGHLIGQLQQENLALTVPSILPREKEAQLPLSYAQQRLWFLDQLQPNSALYNIPLILRLEGTLNQGALEQSLQEICDRHEVLRTNFVTIDGQPTQVIQTGNSQQVTGNSQQVTGNSQQVTGNSQQVTGNSQQVIGNSQQVIGNSQQVIGNSQQVIGNSQQGAKNTLTSLRVSQERVTSSNVYPLTSTSWKVSVVELQHLPVNEQEEIIQQLSQEQATQPFNLASDPLIRATLVVLSETEHLLSVCMHHIVSDGWSMEVFIHELTTLYNAYTQNQPANLAPLPIQYADFALWQRQWLEGEVLQSQLNYWQQQLTNAPALLSLPTDRPRPAVQTFVGAYEKFALSPELTQDLESLGRKQGVTLFMTLLAAFDVLLYRYTGASDILVGTPIANRNRSEIEGLIGFFVNTLVMRTDLSDNPSFSQLLTRVREVAMDAYAHQDLPFEMLVEALQPERDLSHTPLFQVAFVLQNTPKSEIEMTGLKVTDLPLENTTAKFDLTLAMVNTDNGLMGVWEYNTDLFNPSTIERLAGHFVTLLEGIVTNPQTQISQLPLLTEVEQQQLLIEWNNTQIEYPQIKCINQLFEEQAALTPDALAVVFTGTERRMKVGERTSSSKEQDRSVGEDISSSKEQNLRIGEGISQSKEQQLTYQELNCRANQLAYYLKSLGVKPDVLVGICVERSLEMIVGLLAILKAGGAYVPLDPDYPQERLQFAIADAQLSLLLTQEGLLDKLPENQAQLILLDKVWQEISQNSQDNLTEVTNNNLTEVVNDNLTGVVTANNLANLIYTSGSTGKPKGVMVEHRGLFNLAQAHIKTFNLHSDSRILQFASLNFDASIWEIIMAIGSGTTLYLGTKDALMPGLPLMGLLKDYGITHITLPPSALAVLPLEELPKLQTIIVAGEACSEELIKQWATGRNFFNAYGPTETSVCATVEKWTDETEKITIGRPIVNTHIYILDSHLQPVPIGVPGELHIGGMGLARGYFNRPELTKEKFIPNPFAPPTPLSKGGTQGGSTLTKGGNQWSKLYKTGDLARYLPDGKIEYLGRIDNQVKIRGFRIELGEIEALLNQNEAVQGSCVIAREDNLGEKRLVAYVVPQQKNQPNKKSPVTYYDEVNNNYSDHLGQSLKANLKKLLPDYMVPSAFVVLDAFPLTPNGKIDRRALPALDLQSKGEYIAPRNAIEEKLAQIWSKVLKLERVSIDDNFFELGGHSLLATQVISRCQEAFDIVLLLRYLFESPTIAQLSAVILNELQSGSCLKLPSIIPVDRDEDIPLSWAQERIWFVNQLEGDSGAYTIDLTMRLLGNLNVKALEKAFEAIIQRHEPLRTQFKLKDNKPIQAIASNVNFTLPVVNIQNLNNNSQNLSNNSQNLRDAELQNFRQNQDLTQNLTNFETVEQHPSQISQRVTEANSEPFNTVRQNSIKVQQLVKEAVSEPFDLANGSVLRVKLWQVRTDEYVLLLAIHHIAADGWSLGVLIDELSAYYRSFSTETSADYYRSFSTETSADYYSSFSTGTSAALPPLLIQYADFAVWQRQWLTNEVLEQQLSYWKQQLKGVPLLHQLPTDRPRPAIQSFRGGTEKLQLDGELTRQLKKLSQESGSTLFMTLLAGFAVLLSRYSGQTDLVIGSPIANRNRTEIEGLIGFFVNSLALRFDLSQEPTFEAFLSQVRQTTQNAYDHQDLPFEMLVEELQLERHLDRNPLTQIVFALQNAPTETWDLPGVKVEDLPSGLDSVRVDLELYLWDLPEGLRGFCSYNKDLFDGATIARMLQHFQTLLGSIVETPQKSVTLLPLLTPPERYQLLEGWNETKADHNYHKCIHQLIEEQAVRTPDAIAVVFTGTELALNFDPSTTLPSARLRTSRLNDSLVEGFSQRKKQQLTYAQLNSRANQLAHYLRSLGVQTEQLVGICVERSLDMIVGLLGILKAGGAYLPLDPDYPQERLSFMLEDSQVSLLLTQKSLSDRLLQNSTNIRENPANSTQNSTNIRENPANSTQNLTNLPENPANSTQNLTNLPENHDQSDGNCPQQRVFLDEVWEKIAQYSQENLTKVVTPSNLANVIYTSGSTGKPKGVMVEHKGLCNLALAQIETFSVHSSSRVLQFASFSFDACISEILMTLGSGATLYLATKDAQMPGMPLIERLRDDEITHVTLPPSALAVLPLVELPSVQTIIVAGEACSPELVKQWSAGRNFFNGYGPTEGSVCATVAKCTPFDQKVTIGRPIINVQVYILDSNLQPVPIGVPGEIHIGGAGVARGYLNRPELTQEKFIPNLFDLPFAPLNKEGVEDVESLTNKGSNESKLYKTGDLARYLPDGTIEYLGRIDNQVKVRGFRIELGEIEATLSQHPLVQEAIVIARGDSFGDHHLGDTSQTQNKINTNLVGYLVPALKSQVLPEQLAKWQSEYVSDWQKLYEESYSKPQTLTDDPTFNISGWNSSYTGQAIPAEEMREWVENTVSRILAVRQGSLQTQKPQRVLEIGCGSGLLLFRVAEHCQEYWGADYSSATIGNLKRICSKIEGLDQKVRLLHRTADNFEGIPQTAFDTVVINSVVQYFPSVDYLLQVLEGAISAIADQGKIFVGDVRSLPLLESYHAAVQLARAEADKTVEQWQQQVNQSVAAEEELLIDPKFFIALKQRFPQISWVEIEPKRGQSLNELTQFRYDVTLHLDKNPQKLAQNAFYGVKSPKNQVIESDLPQNQVIESDSPQKQIFGLESPQNQVIESDSPQNQVFESESPQNQVFGAKLPQSDETKSSWLNWQRDGFSFAQLQDKLKLGQPTWLEIRDVPNQRVQEALQILDWLENPPEVSTVGDLRQLLTQKPTTGINPEQIWQLGQQLGYTVHLSWWEGSQDGSFDVVFCRNHSTSENALDESALSELTSRDVEVSNLQSKPSFWDNQTVTAKPWTDYTNNPLYGKLVQKLVPQVREFIQQKLPSYMVPQAFVLLNALPLTPNGKVDRRALPTHDTATRNLATGFVAPRTPIEAQMSQIWSEVLGLERIGIKDNFFELGGHSLLATQVISRSRDLFSVELSLQNLLEYPTIANVAQIIEVLTVAQQGQSTITETLEDYEEGEL